MSAADRQKSIERVTLNLFRAGREARSKGLASVSEAIDDALDWLTDWQADVADAVSREEKTLVEFAQLWNSLAGCDPADRNTRLIARFEDIGIGSTSSIHRWKERAIAQGLIPRDSHKAGRGRETGLLESEHESRERTGSE